MHVYSREANRIGEARMAAGLTQQQLADYIGTTTVSIFNWERGRQEPKASVLVAMSNATGRSIEYLLGLEEPDGEALDADGRKLAGYWSQLNTMGRARLLDYARMLSCMPESTSSKSGGVSAISAG